MISQVSAITLIAVESAGASGYGKSCGTTRPSSKTCGIRATQVTSAIFHLGGAVLMEAPGTVNQVSRPERTTRAWGWTVDPDHADNSSRTGADDSHASRS